MAEEQRQCSRGGRDGGRRGGRGRWSVGSSSQKQKEKVPCGRGLGVAELERLCHLEEQRVRIQARSRDMNLTGLPPLLNTINDNDVDEMIKRLMQVKDQEFIIDALQYDTLTKDSRERMPVAGSHTPLLKANASSSSLSSLASMPRQSYPREFPSDQIPYTRSFFPLSPQGDQAPGNLGAKRSYPLFVENPAAPYASIKVQKAGIPITNRPEEPSSFRETDNLGAARFREGPSPFSSAMASSSIDGVKENSTWTRESFATDPETNFSLNQDLSYKEFQASVQVARKLAIKQALMVQRPLQCPYYDFLTPTIPPNNVENAHVNEVNEEDASEDVDLTLKL